MKISLSKSTFCVYNPSLTSTGKTRQTKRRLNLSIERSPKENRKLLKGLNLNLNSIRFIHSMNPSISKMTAK